MFAIFISKKNYNLEDMNGLPPVERKRIQNINFVMEDLHGKINNLYELLVDKEYPDFKSEVSVLVKTLKGVCDSVTNEV